MFATVRDKKNQIAKDLTQDDFTIDEDGRPQTIRYFAKESNLPLTLGLLLDTSGSMRRLIETERGASFKFLDQVLREDKDVAFLIHFDYEVELLQDLTPSRKLLQDALGQLSASNGPQLQQRGQQNPYPGSGGGGGGGRQHGGTTLYDAILLASNELMKKQTGRKAIILLTDGEDSGSKSTMTEAISAAQRADTQCYAIRLADDDRQTRTDSAGSAALVWDGATAADGRRCSRATKTARRFSSGSPRKPAADISRAARRNRSTIFIARFRKSCATSTVWATRRTSDTGPAISCGARSHQEQEPGGPVARWILRGCK